MILPDLFSLITRWWKQMLALIAMAVIAVGIVVFLQKDEWLGVATALPANPVNADKGKIFGQHVQSLYSSLGSAEELDKILGTAQLDTVYLAVAKDLDLIGHYKINDRDAGGLVKAAAALKENTRVIKSDYGELKVKVWDQDRQLAPTFANAVLEKLDSIHVYLQQQNNYQTLQTVERALHKAQQSVDSITTLLHNGNANAANTQPLLAQTAQLTEQVNQYQQLALELRTAIDSNPSVLMVVERAHAAAAPDRPRRLLVILATAIFTLLFSLLMAIVLERKTTDIQHV